MQFRDILHLFLQVLEQRHLLVPAIFQVENRIVVVRDTETPIYLIKACINQLLFFLRHVLNDKVQE